MVRTAEAIFRAQRDRRRPERPDPLVARARPARARASGPSESHGQDVSSLATLWMARYLIRLGRETGEGRHWNRALAMLDAILGRLFPLGLMIRPLGAAERRAARSRTAWPVGRLGPARDADRHDARLRRARLRRPRSPACRSNPALPSPWPHVGLTQHFPCGEVAYRLDRPIGGTVHHLSLKAGLNRPVTLHVAVTCPGLTELGPWQSNPASPLPTSIPAPAGSPGRCRSRPKRRSSGAGPGDEPRKNPTDLSKDSSAGPEQRRGRMNEADASAGRRGWGKQPRAMTRTRKGNGSHQRCQRAGSWAFRFSPLTRACSAGTQPGRGYRPRRRNGPVKAGPRRRPRFRRSCRWPGTWCS